MGQKEDRYCIELLHWIFLRVSGAEVVLRIQLYLTSDRRKECFSSVGANVYSLSNAAYALAPSGAKCKLLFYIPLQKELADADSRTCYKHFAPDGAKTLRVSYVELTFLYH